MLLFKPTSCLLDLVDRGIKTNSINLSCIIIIHKKSRGYFWKLVRFKKCSDETIERGQNVQLYFFTKRKIITLSYGNNSVPCQTLLWLTVSDDVLDGHIRLAGLDVVVHEPITVKAYLEHRGYKHQLIWKLVKSELISYNKYEPCCFIKSIKRGKEYATL